MTFLLLSNSALWRLCAVGIVVLALQACASVAPRNAVPEDEVDQARVPGGTLARMWGDAKPYDMAERTALFKEQQQATGRLNQQQNLLLISGGGANGAFGAGLLKGWSESGTRPNMTIVTGISTGALIAPYAFLGSDYDDELEHLYTTLSTRDLVKDRSLIAGVTGDALFDTTPLRGLLTTYVSDEMIAEIAREYAKGRRLLIGTTNLDARRPVIWNIGAIAEVGTPESAQLIRDVILASASIPGMFPPIRIPVTIGARTYDELHVDGGVTSQVFLYPAEVDVGAAADEIGISTRTIYVIRNSILRPRWEEVKPKLGAVAFASIETLIRTQGLGDLYRLYLASRRDRAAFRLANIPRDFNMDAKEEFDPQYMRALFDLGYSLARDGYEWKSSPPGIELPRTVETAP